MTTSSERRNALPGRDRGQATIELMAMVPLVLAALVFALQVMVLAYTAHGASQAARDGARAYSLNESPVAAAQVTVEAPAMLFITDRQITRSVTMP
jgi:Flp pilus assembly protein TadG